MGERASFPQGKSCCGAENLGFPGFPAAYYYYYYFHVPIKYYFVVYARTETRIEKTGKDEHFSPWESPFYLTKKRYWS